MSTRSAIGYQYDEDSFELIYCHYDGYPEHVGTILKAYHNSFEACEALVNGHQIRNFDHDGTVVSYHEGGMEEYGSVREALGSGFDYCYLFDRLTGWRCYTKRDGKVIEVDIPEPPEAAPQLSFDKVLSQFVQASDAKYGTYAHAAGYLTGVLLQVERELPAGALKRIIDQVIDATAECKEHV